MSEPTKLRDPPEASRRRKPSAKPKGRVTMTDIARAAGCSQATVSFVLNNSPGIRLSKQTRERVIEAARALGYSAPAFSALSEPVVAFEGAGFDGLDGVIGFAVDQLA